MFDISRQPRSSSGGRVTRRAFLWRTSVLGGAAALPQVVSAAVLGANGTVAPSHRITVGFIGTGRQGRHANIPGFLQQADAQAVAVCDVDAWRLAAAQSHVDEFYSRNKPSGTFKGCRAFRDWRELLARQDIDAVMISTPDHRHVLQSIAALKAGKDVACEKPLTRSIAEGRRLADLVRTTGRVFRTDSEFRSSRTYHRAAQLVRNGKIGRVERVTTMTPKDPTLPPQPEMPVPEELDYEMWHRNNSLAHLSLIAIDLGRKLIWDPVAERFVGDPAANARLTPITWREPWNKFAMDASL